MAAKVLQTAVVTAPDVSELELLDIPQPSTVQINEDAAAEKSTKVADPFLVTFSEPYDAENPYDWPASRKWLVTDVMSATGFNRIMVSTIIAPALSTIAQDLDMNATESSLSLSIYLLATAFGPLIIGPLSEVYGRQPILHASGLFFLVFNLLCGFAVNKQMLIACRFFAGFGASAIYSLGAGVLGDIWRPEQRGKSLGWYQLVPLLGAAVGPIIGGFMAERTTWRWMFWATSAFQGFMMVLALFGFHETYGPVILHRRAKRLCKETSDTRYYAKGEQTDDSNKAVTKIGRAFARPLRLLFFHPIIQMSGLLSALDYGILYVTLSTFSNLWTSQYGESVEISGLHYISLSLGEIAGSQLGGRLMDWWYKQKSQAQGTPEARLPLTYSGLAIAWIGWVVYGWTAQYQVFWFVVDLAAFIMMFGFQMNGLPLTGYVIDAYAEHTSSAMSAQQFLRSLFAFCFPLFAPSLYGAIGYGWGNTMLAFVILVFAIPLPLIMWKYGGRLRARAGTVR